MDGIFFLVLAFCTIYTSIKLSYYGDVLSKQSKVGAAFIGGLLIASITSLPELVTCFSAVAFDNPTLSFGDIIGSNMFNIFVLGVYNIYFFNLDVFKNTGRKHIFECLVLIIDYIFITMGTYDILIKYTSLVLFIMYIAYMVYIFKFDNNDEEDIVEKDKYIVLKFMIILSIMLTYQADKISKIYSNFSSSSIGAILLGITTSLPEVVTTFALIKLRNFDMAISNMLGSNIFNFLVLAVADLIVKDSHIYEYSDVYGFYYLIGGVILTLLTALCILPKKLKKLYYVIISIPIIVIYLYVWYLQFI